VNINDEISVLSIAETLSNASEVIHYLEEMYND
jgi:hypothetical protein